MEDSHVLLRVCAFWAHVRLAALVQQSLVEQQWMAMLL
jgi:hypothetical protein